MNVFCLSFGILESDVENITSLVTTCVQSSFPESISSPPGPETPTRHGPDSSVFPRLGEMQVRTWLESEPQSS